MGSSPSESTKYSGIEQLVARKSHKLEVVSSNLTPATKNFNNMTKIEYQIGIGFDFKPIIVTHFITKKKIESNFPPAKQVKEGIAQSTKRFRNKDILL